MAHAVGLVLHFEHDRDVFHALVVVAEYEIALASSGGVIVLFEICVREQGTHASVEDVAAVGLEAFTHHFCGHADLHVLVVIDLFLRNLELRLIFLPDAVLLELRLAHHQGPAVPELGYFLLLPAYDILEFIPRPQHGIFLLSLVSADFVLQA